MKTEIRYNNEIIKYELIRAKIKNLYIYIKEGKVIVKAPIKLKDKYINEFLEKKTKWIYEKLEEDRKKPKVQEEIKKEDIDRLEYIVRKSINKYIELLKEKPNKVRIKDLKYAWGSCSANRNITINKKLAQKDEEVIEYVVLHEMCHLKYMNHSEKFWDLVEINMPEYKKYRKILKTS